MTRVSSTEVVVLHVKLGYPVRRPQFYDYDAYLRSGRPNFTIMMVISSAETQIYSFYKALRRGYPYFGHFTAFFAPFMANLALFGLDLGHYVDKNVY